MSLLQPKHDSSGPAVGLGGSLLSVPLCLLPSALLVVLSVMSVAPLHVCLSVLSVAPLRVCQSVLSPALSVLCVAPLFVLSFLSVVLAVLPVCLSVFSHLAGCLNKIKGFAFVLAKVSYGTSFKP